jgi:hypothetical protein
VRSPSAAVEYGDPAKTVREQVMGFLFIAGWSLVQFVQSWIRVNLS